MYTSLQAFLNIEKFNQYYIKHSLLSHSVVNQWLHPNVQSVEFQLVAFIINQSKDSLKKNKGNHLLSQPAVSDIGT